MTFKHLKFEDSVVMRSLEKLAHEKGLVKPETITKMASTEKSTAPTSNSLVEKVLYLCSQMRKSGFEKQAIDLEHKLMRYKQANTNYQAFSETGEDLIEQAHPKGSHKLEGIDGNELAIIETIIDQQLKNIKIVEKTPTGKLASYDIIGAVKKIVAVSNDIPVLEQELASQISSINSSADGTIAGLQKIFEVFPGERAFFFDPIMALGRLKNQFVYPYNLTFFQEGQRIFYSTYKNLSSDLSPSNWQLVQPKLEPIGNQIARAIAILEDVSHVKAGGKSNMMYEITQEEKANNPLKDYHIPSNIPEGEVGKFNNRIKLLQNWLAKLSSHTNVLNNEAIKSWPPKVIQSLNNIKEDNDKNPFKLAINNEKLDKIQQSISAFESGWKLK